jgi:phospholipase C
MLRLKLGLLSVAVVCLALILSGCGGSSSGNSGPSFTLSLSPSSVSITQGGQATSTITITPQNGFNGSVTLSASGLPTGVTASFNLNPATTSSTLTLTASANAATGTVAVTIMGVSGTMTSSTTLSLTVTGAEAGQIKHVVIIFQENRSTDNLFHDPVLIAAGADIASQGLTSTGQMVTLISAPLVTGFGLGHSHKSFLDECDYNPSTNSCAMDGADTVPCTPNPTGSCPAYPQYQYVQQSDVQPYFTMAETYTFADRMFQTNEGPSFPAHQYILSGTSAIEAASTTSVVDNPGGDYRSDGLEWVGCLAPPGAYVTAIDTSKLSPATKTFTITNELCFEHPTLTDLLDAANLSWKYYAPSAGSIWTAPDAIQHMCVPSPAYPSETSVCTGSDWTNHVVIEESKAQIITDITAGQLSAVSWVIPTGDNSDHPGEPVDNGPSWVSAIVNAVGQSSYWGDTAIIVAWDDWGGWFDHVPPTIRDSYEYGLRVPMIVISPYAKPAYISHVNHDFGSILKFVETVFDLGEIDPSVGYADSRSDDLSDCFNFSQTPLVFTPIPAAKDAEYFLNDNSPPTPPDDD